MRSGKRQTTRTHDSMRTGATQLRREEKAKGTSWRGKERQGREKDTLRIRGGTPVRYGTWYYGGWIDQEIKGVGEDSNCLEPIESSVRLRSYFSIYFLLITPRSPISPLVHLPPPHPRNTGSHPYGSRLPLGCANAPSGDSRISGEANRPRLR